MVNLALMDEVLEVDKEKKRVRVQAGIRVQQLVDGIKDQGLTLQNFASIREQQIGGILQVSSRLHYSFFIVACFVNDMSYVVGWCTWYWCKVTSY